MDIHTYYRLYPELRKRHWQRCYAATELLRIFVARANPEPTKICGIDFPAGSLIILPSDLYESIGMHPLVYDDAMRRLIDDGDITVTEYHYNRIITLTHYPAPSHPAPKILIDNNVEAKHIAPVQPQRPETHTPVPHSPQPEPDTPIAPARPENPVSSQPELSKWSVALDRHTDPSPPEAPHAAPRGQRPRPMPHSGDTSPPSERARARSPSHASLPDRKRAH